MAGKGEAEKVWTREKIKERIEENELDLSLCSISKIPVAHILPFSKVTVLDLSCNRINILPDNFSKLQHLVQLDLSKNGITELPDDFGELNRLKKLDLYKNNLEELPLSFCRLKNLQWLDLKANPIQETLPKLVGDCLKPAECQQCAKNIVAHYSNLYGEQLMREKRAKKLEADRVAKQKQEEDQVRQRRKEEKKKRQEERKLEQNKLKNAAQTNGKVHADEVETIGSDAHMKKSLSGSGVCTKLFYFLVLVLLLGGVGVAVLLGLEFDWDLVQMQAHVKQVAETTMVKMNGQFNDLKTKYKF